MNKTKTLIDAIIAGSTTAGGADKKQSKQTIATAFQLAIAEKIEAALKIKKQVVAQKIYKT